MRRYNRRGFTILELLISIAIIGILVSVGAAAYTSAQVKARDSRRKSDMKAVQNALEQYYADNGSSYPAPGANCNPGPPFLPAGFPSGPKPSESYATSSCTTSTYCVCADVENDGEANASSTCNYSAATLTHFCVTQLQ